MAIKKDTLKSEVETEPLFSWIVCAGCSLCLFLYAGTLRPFGIFFAEFMELYNKGPDEMGWVQTARQLTSFLCYPISGYCADHLPMRFSLALVAATSSLAFAASAFAPNLATLLVTQGVLFAFPTAIIFTVATNGLNRCLRKNRSLGQSICSSWSSIGVLTLPLIYKPLIEAYSVRGLQLMVGGFLLHILIVAFLFEPKKVAETERKVQQEENIVVNKHNNSLHNCSNSNVAIRGDRCDNDSTHKETPMVADGSSCTCAYRDKSDEGHNVTDNSPPVVSREKLATFTGHNQVFGLQKRDFDNNIFSSEEDSRIPDLTRLNISRDVIQYKQMPLVKATEDFTDECSLKNVHQQSKENTPTSKEAKKTVTKGVINKAFILEEDIRSKNRKPSPYNHLQICTKTPQGATGGAPGVFTKMKQSYQVILQNGDAWLYFLLRVPIEIGFFTSSLFLPAFARDLKLSPWIVTLIFPVVGGVEIPTRLMYGYLGDRAWVNKSLVLAISSFACGCLMIVSTYTFTDGATTILTMAASLGAFGGLFLPYCPTMLADIVGYKNVGTAMALSSMLGQLSTSVVTVPLGILKTTTGTYHSCFLVLAVLYFVGGVFCIILFLRKFPCNCVSSGYDVNA